MVETRRCRRRRESPLGWVGLVCTSTTSTDMAPSEGEDGVGWPGLCSLDKGASRRPMIGNQIAAHPTPSPFLRPIPGLGNSLPPPRIPWPPTIHPYSRSSQPYPELTLCNSAFLSPPPLFLSLFLLFSPPTTLIPFPRPFPVLLFSLSPIHALPPFRPSCSAFASLCLGSFIRAN